MMLALETHAIEAQTNKASALVERSRTGLIRLHDALQKQISYEKSLQPDYLMTKSKKKLWLARKFEIIQLFELELERVAMCLEEGRGLMLSYEISTYRLSWLLSEYNFQAERSMASLKSRQSQRMKGFTRNLIDSVHAIGDLDQPEQLEHCAAVFHIQKAIQQLVSDKTVPDMEVVDRAFQSIKNPQVLLSILQLLHVLCNQNLPFFKLNLRAYRVMVYRLTAAINEALAQLRRWGDKEASVLTLLFTQTMQTISSTLNLIGVLKDESGYSVKNERTTFISSTDSRTQSIYETPVKQQSVDTVTSAFGLDAQDEEDEQSGLREESSHSLSSHRRSTKNDKKPIQTKNTAMDLFWGKHLQEETLAHELTFWLSTLSLLRSPPNPERTRKMQKLCFHLFHHKGPDVSVNEKEDLTLSAVLDVSPVGEKDPFEDQEVEEEGLSVSPDQMSLFEQTMESLRGCVGCGSTLVTNLLRSADILVLSLATHNRLLGDPDYNIESKPRGARLPRLIGTAGYPLLSAALALGEQSIAAWVAHLGPPSSAVVWALQDVRLLTATDEEATAAINCANTAFAERLPMSSAVGVLRCGWQLAVHRSGSVFLMGAWMQALVAAALLCLEVPLDQQVTEQDITQELARLAFLRQRLVRMQLVPPKKKGAPLSSSPSRRISFPEEPSTAASVQSEASFNETLNPHWLDRRTSACGREELVASLAKFGQRAVAVVAVLRRSLSLCYSGALFVRLLLREMFLKRIDIEELCTVQLLSLLTPLGMGEGDGVEDDGFDFDFPTGQSPPQSSLGARGNEQHETDASTVQTASTSYTSYPQSPIPTTPGTPGTVKDDAQSKSTFGGSLHTQSLKGPVKPAAYLEAWKEQFLLQALHTTNKFHLEPGKVDLAGYQYQREKSIATNDSYDEETEPSGVNLKEKEAQLAQAGDLILPELIQMIGELHQQSEEVTEQVLLLVHQVASQSHLGKSLLVEAGLQITVQRLLDSQQDSVYIISLCELCSEALYM